MVQQDPPYLLTTIIHIHSQMVSKFYPSNQSCLIVSLARVYVPSVQRFRVPCEYNRGLLIFLLILSLLFWPIWKLIFGRQCHLRLLIVIFPACHQKVSSLNPSVYHASLVFSFAFVITTANPNILKHCEFQHKNNTKRTSYSKSSPCNRSWTFTSQTCQEHWGWQDTINMIQVMDRL